MKKSKTIICDPNIFDKKLNSWKHKKTKKYKKHITNLYKEADKKFINDHKIVIDNIKHDGHNHYIIYRNDVLLEDYGMYDGSDY